MTPTFVASPKQETIVLISCVPGAGLGWAPVRAPGSGLALRGRSPEAHGGSLWTPCTAAGGHERELQRRTPPRPRDSARPQHLS